MYIMQLQFSYKKNMIYIFITGTEVYTITEIQQNNLDHTHNSFF